jgi:hypothetical protein
LIGRAVPRSFAPALAALKVSLHRFGACHSPNDADATSAMRQAVAVELLEHSRRASRYAVRLAQEIRKRHPCRPGLANADFASFAVATLFHDIGKVTIPARLLGKPGRLTPADAATAASISRLQTSDAAI